jgi:hypothetical protein
LIIRECFGFPRDTVGRVVAWSFLTRFAIGLSFRTSSGGPYRCMSYSAILAALASVFQTSTKLGLSRDQRLLTSSH